MKPSRPKVGLALSGGGMRGVAHIGVLQVLEKHDLVPDLLSGSSAGSIVSVLYGVGMKPAEIEQFIRRLVKTNFLDWDSAPQLMSALGKVVTELAWGKKGPFTSAPAGVIKGDRLEELFRRRLAAESFDTCRIPNAVVATDINNGQRVVFTSRAMREKLCAQPEMADDDVLDDIGLADAIRASIAIPGVFHPKKLAGHVLVDGGLTSFVPVDLLFEMGADLVVAVDLGYAGERREEIDNILEMVVQSMDITGRGKVDLYFQLLKHARARSVIRVKPRIYDVGYFDISSLDENVRRGAEAMESCIPEIQEALRERRPA